MRLSATQKDVLFLLYGMEIRGRSAPVLATKLLELLNSVRMVQLYPSNFRASCHTMRKNALIELFHNESLHLTFSLTGEGRRLGAEIHAERVEEQAG